MATALSQQPYLEMEEDGGKQLYRPENFQALPGLLGLRGATDVTPVMAGQFYIHHDSEANAVRSQELLRQVTCNGAPVFSWMERENARLLTGCSVFHSVPDDAKIDLPGGVQIRFFDAFYLIKESLKSGMHHPDGMLWIRMPDRRHSQQPQKTPLTAVAPTILQLMGLPVPEYMRAEPVLFAESTSTAAI
jgi:hypothetical protein